MAATRWLRDVRNGLALAAAYVLCGKLALLLALPPGYASAIFPPAGIAVAAALIGGWRTLPWTFVGSMLLNIWAGATQPEAPALATLGAAAAIAAASTLQAAVGGWMLRRFVGYPSAFDRVHDVISLLFLAPIVCLVSATLSVSGLTALGAFSAAAFATNWATWWIGDTLGVIVMAPIVFAMAAEPRRGWRRRIPAIAVPMGLAFALVVAVFIRANRWEQEESMTEFRSQSRQLADRIQAKFEEQERLLEQMDGLLSHDARKFVTREEFRRGVRRSLLRFPMLQAIEWAPRVVQAQRPQFEELQRADFPDFRITEKDDGARLRPAGVRDSYFPVTYVEPVDGNATAVGFDLSSTPDRLSALARALEQRVPVATAPLRLVQEQGEQFGILLLLGVSEGAGAPGVVLTVLQVKDFIDGALPSERAWYRLALADEETHQAIYGTHVFAGDDPAAFRQVVHYGTRRYLLQIDPTPLYVERHRGWQSWTVLAVGLLGTGLLGGLLLLGTGYTARVEALVGERTDALARESDKNRFFLRNASDGVHILDADGNVLEASDSFCKSLGYGRDELIGMNARQWDAGFSPEKLRAALAERFESQEPSLFETRHRRKDGSVFDVEVSGMALELEGRPVLFNSSRDITERKLAQQALREEEEKLRGLFDLSPLGIALADMAGRLVEFNEAFRHITGYSEAELRALDYRELTPRSYADDERQQWESLARTGRYGPYEKEYVRKDGSLVPLRLNGILVVARDGRQYVWSIVEDISQWKAAETLLQEQRDFLAASRDDLKEAQRIAMLGSWTLDIRRNVLTCSDEIFRIFELDSALFGATYEAFLAAIHPDDRDTVDRAYRTALAERQAYDLVHRVLTADGRIKYVRGRCEIRYDADGIPVLSHGTLQDITQVREAENALRDSEARLRLMTESITDYAIFMLDAEGRVASWNEGAARLKGYAAAEILGAPISRFYLPEDVAAGKPARLLETAAQCGRCQDEGWRVRKDGSRFFADVVVAAMRDAAGRLMGYAKITRDVTERMQYLMEREDLLRKLNTILDNSSVGICFVRDRKQVWTNRRLAEMFGYGADELSDQSTRMFYESQEAFESFGQEAYSALLRGERFTKELQMRRRDGTRIWIRISGKEVDADDAAAGSIWVLEDISDRKAVEEALRRNEARLRVAQRIAQLGNWELDLGTRALTCSDEALRVMALDPDEKPATYQSFLRAVHPDDRDSATARFEQSLVHHVAYELGYRLQPADGSVKYIHQRAEIEFGPDGTPMTMVGTVQDVTMEKLNEQALKESEQRFRTVADYTYDWEYWRGTRGEYLYISPSCERVTGYSQHEFIADPGLAERIVHPDDRQFLAWHLEDYGDEAAHSIDFRIIRKDGGIRWIAHGCRPVFSRDGEFIGRRVSNRDITERKDAEAKVRELAYYDTLTNLPNRRLLMDRLGHALSQAKRFQRSLGLIFLDLDDFKQINDTLGHEAGDDLLREVATRLVTCVRTGDTVCRQGGDEFVIVLTEIAHPADASRVAEKIIQAMEQPYRVAQQELLVTTSIGIAVYPVDGTDDVKELMKKADIAMYAAKKAGRNRYRFFDGSGV